MTDPDWAAAPDGLATSAIPPAAITWPAPYTAAACLTFDMDAESAVLSADLTSAGRMSPMSHQAYGPWSVCADSRPAGPQRHPGDLLRAWISAHRYPGIVRAIAEAGHEIAHHSYFHENTIGMDAATEAAMLDLGLQALQEVAGVQPAGYRAPLWEMNYQTPGLLADRGFRYDSSLMDSDHPYVLAADDEPGGRSLVEVPVCWGLDDWEQYAFLPGLIGSGVIESPAKALEAWTLELEAMHRLGAAFVLCCHPFLSGRPARAEALDRLIQRMRSLPGLWIATVGEVAEHTASLGLAPRTCPQPILPAAAHWISRPEG